ncbi:MAG: hypothetical protein ACLPRE_01110 [Limisphaerales bacterium]
MSTSAQVAANRANARRSTGPANTGSTRFNALRTGLTARGLTPMDDIDGFDALLAQLRAEFQPVGVLENFTVERIGLAMLRRQRGERLEAAFLDADAPKELDPIQSIMGNAQADAPLSACTLENVCNLAGRYETATARRLTSDVTMLLSLQRERRSLASFRNSGGND